MKKHLILATFVCVFTSTACLKTRTQVRPDDSSEASESGHEGVSAKVKEVRPQDSYAVDEIKGEITRLNGRIEDLERAQQKDGDVKKEKEDARKLEARIVELEEAQANMLDSLKKMQNVAAADPTTALEKGKSFFSDGKYDEAAREFSIYLKSGGKNPEEATYLRGEAYFQTKEYKKAIVDFSKFYEKYSSSPKASHAVLRIAQSFEALGMKEDAKSFYQEVVEKYPRSKEAKEAHKKTKK